jgi:hypothetical protein
MRAVLGGLLDAIGILLGFNGHWLESRMEKNIEFILRYTLGTEYDTQSSRFHNITRTQNDVIGKLTMIIKHHKFQFCLTNECK